MKTLVKVMVVLAVLFAGTAGTVSASQDSLPGSPLYALKTSLETWRLDRARTPEKTAEIAMAISDERVSEAVALANKGETVPAGVSESYGEHVNLAFKAVGELEEPAQNQLREKIAKELGDQVQVMEQARVKNNGEDCQLQNMLQVMEQAGNMAQEGNAYQYAGEDTPGVTTKCQGDECEQVGPNAGNAVQNGNGPGEPNEEPGTGNDVCEPNGPNNDGEPGNEDPGQIQDGNTGGEHQGDIGNVNGNGNDNDNSGGTDNQGGQNGGDNGGDNGGGNGDGNGGGNGGGN